MRNSFLLPVALVVALINTTAASAHVGLHTGFALADGLAHPLMGLDHLLVAFAVGLWGAQIGGQGRWLLPMTFVTAMAAGFALTFSGQTMPLVEPTILVSLVIVGLALVLGRTDWATVGAGLCAVFALAHGAAHGQEMTAGVSPAGYVAGLLATTAVLHGLGVLAGAAILAKAPVIIRLFGLIMVGAATWAIVGA